jgi:hypothetical protein
MLLPLYSTAETVAFVRGYEFFSPIDIMATFAGFCILLIFAYVRSGNNKGEDYYKYYMRAFLFKVLFTYANAAFYIIAYGGGGDSIAFWDGSVKLNNLFFEKPLAYFDEMWNNYPREHLRVHFNSNTGYPDGRVYEEKASFFVSKIASVFGFFSFKGYILMSLIFAFIATNASWRLYELVRSFGLHSDWHSALAILFIPSLSFWCGGISKDTIMWVCTCYFIVNLYAVLSKETIGKFKHYIYLLLCLYVFYRVRSFMLMAVMSPLLLTYASHRARVYGNSFQTGFIRFIAILSVIVGILVFFQTSVANEFLAEAQIIYEDMTTNKTYGDKRYTLGVISYTPAGMVAAFPMAVVAGFFRPFIWEALSSSLIINGIESTLLIYFTLRYVFRPKLRQRFGRLMSNDFLVYAFTYALILSFFAGFTSILFGILIRFKAPVLPFLVLILTARENDMNESESDVEHLNGNELIP